MLDVVKLNCWTTLISTKCVFQKYATLFLFILIQKTDYLYSDLGRFSQLKVTI
jgi:hypothetical protein